ncbi:unnamed protein product [Amoebophrya sp. A25]|nr:unnamed protein product [Amoebophrya sp. A25]|eukprot:GSA25T00022491001.1
MPSNHPSVCDVKLLPPDQVRFSQNTVGANFKNGGSVQDLTNAVRSGKVNPQCDIPPIRAFETKKGNLVTHDNRRLKVFKDAGVPQVPVLITKDKVPDFKFTTEDHGKSVQTVKRGDGKGGCNPKGTHSKGNKGGASCSTSCITTLANAQAKASPLSNTAGTISSSSTSSSMFSSTASSSAAAPFGVHDASVCHETWTRTVKMGDKEVTDKYERTTYSKSTNGNHGKKGAVDVGSGKGNKSAGTKGPYMKSVADASRPQKGSGATNKSGKAGPQAQKGSGATNKSGKAGNATSSKTPNVGKGNGKGAKPSNNKKNGGSAGKQKHSGGKNATKKKG